MDSFASNRVNEFVEFAVEIGHRYLAAGGPTSRIEERIFETGLILGMHTEVFATPTGVFVTVKETPESTPVTQLGRIQVSATDLSELIRLERLLDQVQKQDTPLAEALNELDHPKTAPLDRIHQWVTRGSFVSLGFSASFATYGSWTAGLISGALCWAVGFFSGPLGDKWGWSGIFTHFLAVFFALVVSGYLSQTTGLPADALVIGTLILVVPGLSLTSAISELAEQNFVSGTAKMMKSVLILLAMGTAFLLVTDLSILLFPGIDFRGWALAPQQDFLTQVLSHSLIIASFSAVFKSPYRYIPFALIPGLLSWYVFQQFSDADFIVLSSFVPALIVGFISLLLGRFLKVPSQLFSVPGILSLVPGMLALSTFYAATNPSGVDSGSAVSFQVLIVASAIVFGLLTARVPFSIMRLK